MNVMIEIRIEAPGDYSAIHQVHVSAFGGDVEARLVELLRNRNKVSIALVAVVQAQVVGHIMFSPITVAHAPANFRGLGLAPVGVLPEFQNKGIGSSLIRAGLEVCKREGYDAVVLLGHPTYYPRFGFSIATKYGLDNEYNATDAFQVIELKAGALRGVSGLVKYAPEFSEAEC